jgi:hypothetical protein
MFALVLALATPAHAAAPCKPSDIESKQLDRVASKDWGDDVYCVVGELVNRCRTRVEIGDLRVAFNYGVQDRDVGFFPIEADPGESVPFAKEMDATEALVSACTASDICVKQVRRGISLPSLPGTFVVHAAAENRCKAPTYF